MSSKQKVLMICFGNTCRSTIAEAVFKDIIIKIGSTNEWEVDSAGLRGYHLGEAPNEKAMITLRRNGIMNYSHHARVITSEDFFLFDWILGMDNGNMVELNLMKPEGSTAKIALLGNFDPNGENIIRDPYCDPDCTGFVKAYEQCERSITNFLEMHHKNTL